VQHNRLFYLIDLLPSKGSKKYSGRNTIFSNIVHYLSLQNNRTNCISVDTSNKYQRQKRLETHCTPTLKCELSNPRISINPEYDGTTSKIFTFSVPFLPANKILKVIKFVFVEKHFFIDFIFHEFILVPCHLLHFGMRSVSFLSLLQVSYFPLHIIRPILA
jgi:hypothetical protein